jgi:hypothetical protein
MPGAIIAGLPIDAQRRVRAALVAQFSLGDEWTTAWIHSKGRNPGIAPTQIPEVLTKASELGGAHVLALRGHNTHDDRVIIEGVQPYFRIRWVEKSILRFIPGEMSVFIAHVQRMLAEELGGVLRSNRRMNRVAFCFPSAPSSATAASNTSGRSLRRVELNELTVLS